MRAGGLAGVAGLSASAGCLGFLGGGGGDGTTTTRGNGDGGNGDGGGSGGETSTTTPPPEVNSYLKWLPTPEQFEGDASYSYNYHGVAEFREYRDTLHEETYDQVKSVASRPRKQLALAPNSIQSILQVGTRGTKVVLGGFDKGQVGSEVERRDFEKRESYGGYDLYQNAKGDPTAVAVGGSAVLICRRSGGNQPLAVARMLIDTSKGELDRYVVAHRDFSMAARPVTDATRAGALLLPEPPQETSTSEGQFKNNTAFGFGFTVGGSTTEMRFVYVFSTAKDAKPGPVRTWLDDGGQPGIEQYDDYSVAKDGRTVRITGTIPTEKFDFLDAGNPGEEELD